MRGFLKQSQLIDEIRAYLKHHDLDSAYARALLRRALEALENREQTKN